MGRVVAIESCANLSVTVSAIQLLLLYPQLCRMKVVVIINNHKLMKRRIVAVFYLHLAQRKMTHDRITACEWSDSRPRRRQLCRCVIAARPQDH